MKVQRPATPIPETTLLFQRGSRGSAALARSSLTTSAYLPPLNESSKKAHELTIGRPPYSEAGCVQVEIVALSSGSPVSLKRGQLLRSRFEKRNSSLTKLPDLCSEQSVSDETDIFDSNGSRIGEWSSTLCLCSDRRSSLTSQTRKKSEKGSHSESSNSSRLSVGSLPIISSSEESKPLNTVTDSSALKKHIEQAEKDYDVASTKAVIFERWLESQRVCIHE